MPMQVHHTFNFIFISQHLNFLTDRPDLRMQVFGRVLPVSVQIEATHITAEIAIDHAIDVDHREYLYGVVL